jgi:hypothetical protein
LSVPMNMYQASSHMRDMRRIAFLIMLSPGKSVHPPRRRGKEQFFPLPPYPSGLIGTDIAQAAGASRERNGSGRFFCVFYGGKRFFYAK